MFKKIGISLLLAFAMLISTFNVGAVTRGYAAPPACTTIAECREVQRVARDNIAEIIEEEDELRIKIEEVQNEISTLRDEIAVLEDTIRDLDSKITDLANEIADLADDIENNLAILDEIEERIEVLIDEISERMRLTQRVNNRNSLLVMMSEAESLTTFLRVTRTFNRIATDDAELMDELTDLVELQENLLLELGQQQEELETNREILETKVAELEVEQDNLEVAQYALMASEAEMREMYELLNEERMTEEEILEAAEAIEAILERTPPPLVAGTGTSSGIHTPNNSGLAHPMPGATVTSPFGPRWGRHHAGVDLVVRGNSRANILAAASGTVVISEWHSSMGWYVVISHNIEGSRVDTVYAHLRYQPSVSVNQAVSQGDVIGVKGNTGNSFGDHLHFEVHPGGFAWVQNRGVNPCGWISC